MIPHLLLLIHHLSLPAQAARIPPPSSNPTSLSLFNLTSGNDPNISPGNPTAIRVDVPYLYCTPTRRWNQPAMEQEDCRGVLGYLYHETMTDGGRGSMEFMSPGARKTRKIKGQMTPRKYTFARHLHRSDSHDRRLPRTDSAAGRVQNRTADGRDDLFQPESRGGGSCQRLCLGGRRGGLAAHGPEGWHRSVHLVDGFSGGQGD